MSHRHINKVHVRLCDIRVHFSDPKFTEWGAGRHLLKMDPCWPPPDDDDRGCQQHDGQGAGMGVIAFARTHTS